MRLIRHLIHKEKIVEKILKGTSPNKYESDEINDNDANELQRNLYNQITQELKVKRKKELNQKPQENLIQNQIKIQRDKHTIKEWMTRTKIKRNWRNVGISQTDNADIAKIVINYTKISAPISNEQEYAETKTVI